MASRIERIGIKAWINATRVRPSILVMSLLLVGTAVEAQSAKVEGLIKSRNGDGALLQGNDSANITVLLPDGTRVGQVHFFSKARKEMSMAAWIPVQAVKVEGRCNDQRQVVATSVAFKGNNSQRAESSQAGTRLRSRRSKTQRGWKNKARV
jgi:hypothetical protein